MPRPSVLILVENLPVPLDRRVWQEAGALRDAGYEVAVISPRMRGFNEPEEVLEGIRIYRHWMSEEAGGFWGFLREYGSALWGEGLLAWKAWWRHGSTGQLATEFLSDLMAVRLLQVYYYPEFMRESTAVEDFDDPALAIVGTRDGSAPPRELIEGLFGEKTAVTDWPIAEMVKYTCNAFHAAKIAFANEIGRLGKQMKIDSRRVMELLCQDTKLNLSATYLRPGNPFGGSCLPKDVRALAHHARQHGLNLPMLENLLASNERHLQSLLSLIAESGQSEVVILGLAFKAQTDDLRESAMLEVAQTLLGRGCKLRIYDPTLNLETLVGSNKRVIDAKMPHLASLLCADLKTAVGREGMIVAAQKCAALAELREFITSRHQVLDVNGWPELRELPCRYEGFCW